MLSASLNKTVPSFLHSCALDGTRNSSVVPPCEIDPTTHRTMSEHSTPELHHVFKNLRDSHHFDHASSPINWSSFSGCQDIPMICYLCISDILVRAMFTVNAGTVPVGGVKCSYLVSEWTALWDERDVSFNNLKISYL